MNVHCIKCGESGNVLVDLEDGRTLTCGDCENQYTVDDVREVVESWAKVLPWLAMHPARCMEPEVLAGKVR